MNVSEPSFLLLLGIGLLAGLTSGLFGVGGGLVIVPALIYLAAFRQHVAIGTSVAVLLLPMQLVAAYEYYRHGNIDIRAAAMIAAGTLVGAWLGAIAAHRVSGAQLRLAFGIFVVAAGLHLIHDAAKQLGLW